MASVIAEQLIWDSSPSLSFTLWRNSIQQACFMVLVRGEVTVVRWMRRQMIHSFEGSLWLRALPSVSVWAGNSEALARTARLNTASLEQTVWWTVQLWLPRRRKLRERGLFPVRSLVWNGRSSLWKAGPTALKALEKSYQPGFDSHGREVWPLCARHSVTAVAKLRDRRQSGAQETSAQSPCTCQLWLQAGCICRACSASVQEPGCLQPHSIFSGDSIY